MRAADARDATAPVRVAVPAVGIDAAVVPITPRDGVLDPPTFGEAYWVQPYGHPSADASGNTTYLAGHSATRGGAVFDPLFDRRRQVARVGAGDEVVVTTGEGRFVYEVAGAARYEKASLAGADEVWRVSPRTLVLITCFQEPGGGPSRDNLVVTAVLRSAPGWTAG